MKAWLPKVSIALICMLLLSVAILQAGRYSYASDHGSQNVGPSGTSAFAEILRTTYSASTTKGIKPLVKSNQVMVAFVDTNKQKLIRRLARTLPENSTLVAFLLPYRVNKKTSVAPLTVKGSPNQLGLYGPIETDSNFFEDIEDDPTDKATRKVDWIRLPSVKPVPIIVQTNTLTPFVVATQSGNRKVICVADGSGLTNEFIDKHDNAKTMFGLLNRVIGKNSNVTLLIGFAGGESDGGLIETLGPFVKGVWSQLLLLIVIIFATLSVRFGLEPERRAIQRGGRELVDGLATMIQRKRRYGWALRAIFDRTILELERRHRIPRERIIARPDQILDSESAANLKYAEAATVEDSTEEEALRHAHNLNRLV